MGKTETLEKKEEKNQASTSPPPNSPMSSFKKGFILLIISSLMLSFQNVVTKIILSKKIVLGNWELGGIIKPSPDNSLLILVMRIAIVLPILSFIIAPRMHKNTWSDIKSLFHHTNHPRLFAAMGSGLCLFVSQFFIYIALGNIPTGVATTIFFIYPTATILLVWIFYRDKPTLGLVFAMVTIYIGIILTIPMQNFQGRVGMNYPLGAITASISGIAFAGYVVLIKSAKLHPAPFSVITFAVILFFGSLMLPLVDFHVDPNMWVPLLVGTLVLAFTTLVGYLLNNAGVPIVGPAMASVIGSSGPALTTAMAFLIIDETVNLYQTIGVVLVTLWVLGISIENMKKQAPPPK